MGLRDWAVIGIGLAVATLPAVMPVMVGALAAQPGIGVARAGYIVSANMGGIFAGTLVCVWLIRWQTVERLLLSGLLVMVAGNLVTLTVSGFLPITALRFISGLGEGLAASMCYALMGQARVPGRAVAIYAAGQAVVGALGMAVLPTLIAHYGWQSFYVAVSAVAFPAMLCTRFATRHRALPPPHAGARRFAPVGAAAALLLLAIFLFFSGLASVWAFMEPIGRARGLNLTGISAALSASSIASLGGSLAVASVARRLGVRGGNLIGAVAITVSVVAFSQTGLLPFTVAVAVLGFNWAFQLPLMFRSLVSVDDGGATALTPMATGGGLMAGPAAGGLVMQYAGTGWMMVMFAVLALGALALAQFVSPKGAFSTPIGRDAAPSHRGNLHA